MVLLALLISGMNVLNEEPALSGIFTFPAIVLLIISAIGGLFNYQDYPQNTIRNKIVVGHSRAEVYLAKTITIFVLHIMVVATFMLLYGVIGCSFLDTEYVVWEAFGKNCAIVLSSTLVVAAITSMISINIKSPLGGLLPMIFVSSILFGGIFGMEILSVNDAEQAIKMLQSVPVTCLLNCSEIMVPDNMRITITTSIVVTMVFVTIGYLAFRKADLK
jgi:hypothetical protein